MIAPELRVTARMLDDGTIELADVASLVDVNIVGRNRVWRRRVIQHVSACSGVPAREIVRELAAAERRAS